MSRQFAALAEPSRLRLMLACRERERLVGQLASALGLPEPAVSRHLATLARAGLLTRVQSGREVRYLWSREARNLGWLEQVFSPANSASSADKLLQRDQARLARMATGNVAETFAVDSLFGQRLGAAFHQLSNRIASARALAFDVRHGPVLAWLQESTAQLRLVTTSPALRRAVGAFGREQGLAFDWVVATDPKPDFDLVCIEALTVDDLGRQLANAAAWLAPRGRVVLGLPYDALDDNEAGNAHPLFKLRALLAARGFSCDQLLPIEAAGDHWLLATGLQAALAVTAQKKA